MRGARADGSTRASASTSSSSTSSARSSATSAGASRPRSTRTRASSSTSTPRRSCARILFEKLGLTPVKKTKTGPSTDADSLQKMADEHPIVETLLRYREVEKLRSTYADALPPLVGRRRSHPRDVQPARDHDRPDLVASRRTCRTCRCAPSSGRELRRGVHRRRRLRAAHRRLLADRAARARAPRRGPGPHRRVRARRRRAHHHRGRGVRRRPRTRSTSSSAGSPRSSTTASRTAWRPTVSRNGSTSPPTRRARSSTPTSPRSRTSPTYMQRDDPRGEGARLHHHAVRPAPPAPRAVVRQLPHPPDGGAHGAERAGAGHARPTSSSSR